MHIDDKWRLYSPFLKHTKFTCLCIAKVFWLKLESFWNKFTQVLYLFILFELVGFIFLFQVIINDNFKFFPSYVWACVATTKKKFMHIFDLLQRLLWHFWKVIFLFYEHTHTRLKICEKFVVVVEFYYDITFCVPESGDDWLIKIYWV